MPDTVGFIIAGLLAASLLLVKTRLPPRKATGPVLDISVFTRDAAFALFCINAFVISLGLYLPFYCASLAS